MTLSLFMSIVVSGFSPPRQELEERDVRRAARDERKRLQAERKLEEAIQVRSQHACTC